MSSAKPRRDVSWRGPAQHGFALNADAPLTVDDLYDRHAAHVARVALKVLGSNQDVDDVVQEVFIIAARKLDTLTDPTSIASWLATIAVRRIQRKLRRRKIGFLFGRAPQVDPDSVVAPGCPLDDRVAIAQVYAALERLPTAARIAWALRYMEGEKLSEVATMCGCSLATAKRRIAVAQAVVAEVLGDG